MRRQAITLLSIIAVYFAFSLTSASRFSQINDGKERSSVVPNDTTAHEFHYVTDSSGTPITRQLRYVNNTDGPLEFKSLRTGCTCVQASFSPKLLMPKQSGVLELLMDSRRNGTSKQAASVLFTNNTIWEPSLTLVGHPSVRVIGDSSNWSFGIVKPEASSRISRSIEFVLRSDAEPWRLGKINVKHETGNLLSAVATTSRIEALPDGLMRATADFTIELKAAPQVHRDAFDATCSILCGSTEIQLRPVVSFTSLDAPETDAAPSTQFRIQL